MKARLLVVSLSLLATPALWAQGAAISTPEAREKALADLAKITAGRAVAPAAAPAKDPFNPPAADLRDVAPGTSGEGTRRSDAELLPQLAALIQPTGSMTLGGEPVLLFTERRQKIGDKVAVTLDGVEYIVEIVSIANNRFRIRYNDKEAERTIK
ncbi:MAG TPA: hypothetical protein PK322_16050 [Opitutaceae bacterium]|nr:hypothetical protein [Opitutaceae bacterium]